MPTATSKRPTDASMAIEMLREHSLATLAQQELERRIISGEIAAGTKLNEVEVAAALGVSRGPVREAFSALSQAGLVRVEKNRGVFVRQVSIEEANEFYEVRAALEGLIGKLAARRIAIDEIEQLRAVVRRMQQTQRKRSAARSFLVPLGGRALQGSDLGGAGQPTRRRILRAERRVPRPAGARRTQQRAAGPLPRRRQPARPVPPRHHQPRAENIPLSTQEHEAIVDAVAARDEQRAEALLTEHVLVSRARLHAALGTAGPAKA